MESSYFAPSNKFGRNLPGSFSRIIFRTNKHNLLGGGDIQFIKQLFWEKEEY